MENEMPEYEAMAAPVEGEMPVEGEGQALDVATVLDPLPPQDILDYLKAKGLISEEVSLLSAEATLPPVEGAALPEYEAMV